MEVKDIQVGMILRAKGEHAIDFKELNFDFDFIDDNHPYSLVVVVGINNYIQCVVVKCNKQKHNEAYFCRSWNYDPKDLSPINKEDCLLLLND